MHRKPGPQEPQLTQAGIESDFEEDWRILLDFFLIKPKADKGHFEMHRLVQFATRSWLKSHNELQDWINRYLIIMDGFCPAPSGLTIAECMRFFPHHMESLLHFPTVTPNKSKLQAFGSLIY